MMLIGISLASCGRGDPQSTASQIAQSQKHDSLEIVPGVALTPTPEQMQSATWLPYAAVDVAVFGENGVAIGTAKDTLYRLNFFGNFIPSPPLAIPTSLLSGTFQQIFESDRVISPADLYLQYDTTGKTAMLVVDNVSGHWVIPPLMPQ